MNPTRRDFLKAGTLGGLLAALDPARGRVAQVGGAVPSRLV